MKFRITVLCENSVGPISGTLGEHGFAALIEPAGGSPLLFDTGQGATLLHNAARMNKDLSLVAGVVLSHGHYDHCGGLLPLLQTHGPRTVYAHPGVFTGRFRVKDTGECIPIGASCSRETWEAAGAAFQLGKDWRSLAPGVWLTGEVPRQSVFETGDTGLYCDCASHEADTTPDDQSLVLESSQGLVLILGCCHTGLINTLEHVALTLGRRDIYAVIGGTHLSFCGPEQMERTLDALKGWNIARLAVSHCTGFTAAARLMRAFPRQFHTAAVGYTLEI